MRSDDGGQNWGVASYWWFDSGDPFYAHADQHAITFHPKFNGDSNRTLFVASDGGMHRTTDARAAVGTTLPSICGNPATDQVQWTSLNNGYQVTQFYHGAVYPNGTTFFGGTQDNGTLRGSTAVGQNWQTISGGDGGYVAVDKLDTNVLYSEFTGKSLQRSLNGGATWVPIHGGVTEAAGNFQFIHPFAMDPTAPARLWYGGAFAWRGNSNNRGTTWTRVSNSFASRIASWGISPSNPDRVYAGVQHLAPDPGRQRPNLHDHYRNDRDGAHHLAIRAATAGVCVVDRRRPGQSVDRLRDVFHVQLRCAGRSTGRARLQDDQRRCFLDPHRPDAA